MSLYASVCNNTVVMWLLFIELFVRILRKNNTGKIYVTQGKLRENTGNFILARMWPPCCIFGGKGGGGRSESFSCTFVTLSNIFFFWNCVCGSSISFVLMSYAYEPHF